MLDESKFGFIVNKARARTPEQALKALIRAGIVTPDGELADRYKEKPEAASVAKAPKPPAPPKRAKAAAGARAARPKKPRIY